MCGFKDAKTDNYFSVIKLENDKLAGEDEVTGNDKEWVFINDRLEYMDGLMKVKMGWKEEELKFQRKWENGLFGLLYANDLVW